MTVKPSWALETTVLAVEQVALLFRTNGLSTLYGISVVNGRKGGGAKFRTSSRGRITTQPTGVIKQGYTTCSRGLYTFCRIAPSMLGCPDRAGMHDLRIPSNHNSGIVYHLLGISHKVRWSQ